MFEGLVNLLPILKDQALTSPNVELLEIKKKKIIILFKSWHLAMALLALQYNHMSKSCVETIHDSYATQLQSIGLWHWSVFVIMHIEDARRLVIHL
jgi:hypothetical protein